MGIMKEHAYISTRCSGVFPMLMRLFGKRTTSKDFSIRRADRLVGVFFSALLFGFTTLVGLRACAGC